MWVREMEAIEKTASGFMKLTAEDFKKLEIKRSAEQEADEPTGKEK
ncbi:MAG: hypothetical protein ACQEXX_19780 [Bacillota bacterium]